jgi:hypothetical protein
MGASAFSLGGHDAPGQKRPANLAYTRRTRQAGVLEAVAAFLGHEPARCDVCRPATAGFDRTLLLTALAAEDFGKIGKVRQAIKLAILLRRASRRQKSRPWTRS